MKVFEISRPGNIHASEVNLRTPDDFFHNQEER